MPSDFASGSITNFNVAQVAARVDIVEIAEPVGIMPDAAEVVRQHYGQIDPSGKPHTPPFPRYVRAFMRNGSRALGCHCLWEHHHCALQNIVDNAITPCHGAIIHIRH